MCVDLSIRQIIGILILLSPFVAITWYILGADTWKDVIYTWTIVFLVLAVLGFGAWLLIR